MELANGDPIWISVARAGVIVKRSRMGLMGAKLYDERNAYKAAMTAKALDAQIVGYTTPSDMTNPVLRALTQAALDCESAAAVSVRFNEALTKSSQS
jgi:hypothetical protein